MIAARLAEVRAATMLLTRLPLGRIAATPPPLSAAGWAFPLIGALIGVAGWGAWAIAAASGLPEGISALFAVAATLWLTGALHEDGLADCADGIGGGRDREARLSIMRDSRIGTYGALALIVALGVRVLAITEVGAHGALLAGFVAMAAGSRFAMLAVLALMPPARHDGLGHGAGRPGVGVVAWGALVALLLLVPLGQAAPAAAAMMALAAALTGLVADRKLGGQTGDVLGAVQVVAELVGWLTLVAMIAGH